MAFNNINVRLKLIIFLLLSILISFLPWNILKDEFGLVEISQILLILNSIIIGFKQKKLICKCNRKYIFWIKQILLLMLFYEEISFLTTNSFYFLDFINKQNELNIHNAKFLEHSFFEFSIFPQDTINISFGLFISIVAPLIWGFGSLIKNLNSFRYIFLERSTSLFCLIYPITVIISYLSRNIILGSPEFILNSESIELFLYFLLLIDLKEKIKFYKFKYK